MSSEQAIDNIRAMEKMARVVALALGAILLSNLLIRALLPEPEVQESVTVRVMWGEGKGDSNA